MSDDVVIYQRLKREYESARERQISVQAQLDMVLDTLRRELGLENADWEVLEQKVKELSALKQQEEVQFAKLVREVETWLNSLPNEL